MYKNITTFQKEKKEQNFRSLFSVNFLLPKLYKLLWSKREYITANGLSDTWETKPSKNEIIHCENWIKEFCHPQKYINPCAYSYSLKHRAENWERERVHWYVTNGAFIQAAVNLGYKYKRICNGPNADFNMYISSKAKRAV